MVIFAPKLSVLIQLHDLTFEPYLPDTEISNKVDAIAERINADYGHTELHIVSALTGSFMFTSDLVRRLHMPCYLHFIKLSSYHGSTQSSGSVTLDAELKADLAGKHVLISEDIIDSGLTAGFLHSYLMKKLAASIKIAALLFKPDAYKGSLPVDYPGFSIPNDFVVGYGLDYKELGRNLKDIYKLKDS